jgi:predicted heme/steroid binding protein/uncharacterized membrane protein
LPEDQSREFTLEELAEHDGADGKSVYIAHDGKVYDVSGSSLWDGGEHMGSHRAGGDLTGEIGDAPHGREVFERYPQVGVLRAGEAAAQTEAPPQDKTPAPDLRQCVEFMLHKVPMLRRHPHPMVVHFPIVFMISTTVFTVLYFLTGLRSFEVTAFHCLGGGVLFTPVAMVTGLFTWWLNYLARPLRPVIIKLILSPLLFAVAAGAFVWRLLDPDILANLGHWTSMVYLGLICSLTPLASVVGWYGACLTFPLRAE